MRDTEFRQVLTAFLEGGLAALRSDGPPAPPTGDHDHDHDHDHGADPGCTLRALPRRLWEPAARTATRINPVNSPYLSGPHELSRDVMSRARLAVLTTKYWGPSSRTLTVSFMDSPPADLRQRIVAHMNAWTRSAAVSFAETSGVGTVRIARIPDGYWSYLGTDILHIPPGQPTMNLQGFSMQTPEAEYKRVVRHETGHTLGFPHEHMRRELVARIDPEKAYAYFWQRYGWDRQTVDEQVLRALDDASIIGTPADQTSIMAYQLPGAITFDGRPITGGDDINATDYAFAGRIYPGTAATTAVEAVTASPDWPEADDVTPDIEALAA